jgi:hypothetical protein
MGWIGLGDLKEAREELAKIHGSLQHHPDVLELRWEILALEKNWPEALQVARELIHHAPERSSGWLHQAYALRRAPGGGLKEAWHTLLPVFDKFPREPIICYNLSCYACQLQFLDAARVWLKRAAVLGGKAKIKEMAREDVDLQPLWQEIDRL